MFVVEGSRPASTTNIVFLTRSAVLALRVRKTKFVVDAGRLPRRTSFFLLEVLFWHLFCSPGDRVARCQGTSPDPQPGPRPEPGPRSSALPVSGATSPSCAAKIDINNRLLPGSGPESAKHRRFPKTMSLRTLPLDPQGEVGQEQNGKSFDRVAC